jgi:hypothetical protein
MSLKLTIFPHPLTTISLSFSSLFDSVNTVHLISRKESFEPIVDKPGWILFFAHGTCVLFTKPFPHATGAECSATAFQLGRFTQDEQANRTITLLWRIFHKRAIVSLVYVFYCVCMYFNQRWLISKRYVWPAVSRLGNTRE